jgi:hypothetical protein
MDGYMSPGTVESWIEPTAASAAESRQGRRCFPGAASFWPCPTSRGGLTKEPNDDG